MIIISVEEIVKLFILSELHIIILSNDISRHCMVGEAHSVSIIIEL